MMISPEAQAQLDKLVTRAKNAQRKQDLALAALARFYRLSLGMTDYAAECEARDALA
jgi:hypothetical protein